MQRPGMRRLYPPTTTKEMISINLIGVGATLARIKKKINDAGADAIAKEKLLRGVAGTLLADMKRRIHQDGRDSDGNAIGTYTPSYIKYRQFGYKGTNFTRGKKKGQDRGDLNKKPNRSADPKVILSLTGKMENTFVIGATSTGYALGFTNDKDFQKSKWCEQTYNKPIYKPMIQEVDRVQSNALEYVRQQLK